MTEQNHGQDIEASGGAAPAEPALHVDGLAKTYGDTPALVPTTLTIGSGERVAIIGHNGSGKTTLLKMVVGLLDATAGSSTIFGHPGGSQEARRAASWLSDTPTFYDDLSLIEHLEYVSGLHAVAAVAADDEDTPEAADWRRRADDLMSRFGLSERADDLPTTFSRGLRQKAAICIATIRPLRLLLVDEPFVGLDTAGKEALLQLFDDIANDGATLVVATHELSFLDRVERVIALRDGEVVFDGAPSATDLRSLTDR